MDATTAAISSSLGTSPSEYMSTALFRLLTFVEYSKRHHRSREYIRPEGHEHK
jgi:hypothetical protein